MATQRCSVTIEKMRLSNLLHVYADLDAKDTITQVEGVLRVRSAAGYSHSVNIDPRYDIDEVAADIESAIEAAAQDRAAAAVAEAELLLKQEPAP